jgi:hypothetical protein
LRSIRTARYVFRTIPDATPKIYGEKLRHAVNLPDALSRDAQFCELLKLGAQIAEDQPRNASIEQNVIREERNQCYLCGIELVGGHTSLKSRTIEHLWPLGLAGQTIEDNLLPACKDCNNKRGHGITWAWGPVQSTYESLGQKGQQPEGNVRLALAFARLMLEASEPTSGHRAPSTLKQAAKHIWPAVPSLDPKLNWHHVFFDYFQLIEV